MRYSLIAPLLLSLSLTAQGEEQKLNNGTLQAGHIKASAKVEQPQVHSVHALFQQYKQAALNDDGRTVASLMSRDSVKHYGRLKKLALDSSSSMMDLSIRLVDQIQVKVLREMIPAEQFTSMSDQEVLAHAFAKKVLGEDLESTSKFDPITISNGTAIGYHTARGRTVGQGYREVTFRMIKEQGDWRLDLLHSLDLMEAQIHDLAAVSEKSAQEIADNIAEAFIGKTIAKQMTEQKLADTTGSAEVEG